MSTVQRSVSSVRSGSCQNVGSLVINLFRMWRVKFWVYFC